MPLSLFSQSGVWERWDEEVVRRLHTAAGTEYLNEEEKKVILFMNLARHNGPLFADTYLETYVEENGLEPSRYIRSLFRDLNKTLDLPLLHPEQDLTAVAQGHSMNTGRTGRVGHQGFKRRFEPLMGNPYDRVAENCSYGYEQAIDIVISLLIDEGVSDMGHRKNMLNGQLNSVGVAIRPHKNYRVNCVIDFGHRTRSGLNEIPF